MKRYAIPAGIIIISLLLLSTSCTTSPTTTPVTTTANLGDVGQDSGTASATESGSAVNHNTPFLWIINGGKKVTIEAGKGTANVTVDGAEDSEVTISGGAFGYQRFGDDGMQAEVSSGGGAAGGTGGASRANSGTQAGGSVSPTPAGGGN